MSKEPWTDSNPSTTIARPQRGRWGIGNRRLRAGMHLMFAVTLLSLSAGFVHRAVYGEHNFFDRVRFQQVRLASFRPWKQIIFDERPPENRRTIVHTTSDSIFGDFHLLDLLDLKTTSGTIDITVSPQVADEDGPAQAAEFVGQTMSGSIRANLAFLTRIPSREYITRVSSTSGSVSGTYLMGSTTTFRTTSGSMNLVLLPAAYGSDPPSLVTSGVSDSQVIVILASQDPTALQAMTLDSHSVSGTVTVRCPGDFEGIIQAGTISGDIVISGPGVKIVKDVHSPGSRYVEATKGIGAGRIVVNTVSGSVRVFIG